MHAATLLARNEFVRLVPFWRARVDWGDDLARRMWRISYRRARIAARQMFD
jgi:hypothetical protein